MMVREVRTQTALRREVSGPDQLDDLLSTLSEMRIPLVDVHLAQPPAAAGAGPTYEVRVDGEVGEPLLRYLKWSHAVVPGHVRVRIAAATRELLELLRACSESGSTIEHVHLVTADEGPRTR